MLLHADEKMLDPTGCSGYTNIKMMINYIYVLFIVCFIFLLSFIFNSILMLQYL